MSSTHLFAPAHGVDGHVLAARSVQKGKKRPRKHEDENGSESDDAATIVGESSNTATQSRPTSRAESHASLTADQLEQYRTAGLEPGDGIPQYPFPHRSTSPPRNVRLDVQAEIQQLKPRLAHVENVVVGDNDGKETLREQHQGVLTAILHTMLLKGDYHRAGRAWGLLLRSGYMAQRTKVRSGHKAMDVRTHSRWGIGAEILIRGGTSVSQISGEKATAADETQFSEEGFRKAREYYERLIVQYPEHHRRKGASAGAFYAAMFSLWIYEVSEKSKRDRSAIAHGVPPTSTSRDQDSSLLVESSPPATERDLDAIRQEELRGALEISTRLDEILRTPPFDKNTELFQLRGNIALWMANLGTETNRAAEVERAQAFFERAQANGRNLWEEIEDLEIIDEG